MTEQGALDWYKREIADQEKNAGEFHDTDRALLLEVAMPPELLDESGLDRELGRPTGRHPMLEQLPARPSHTSPTQRTAWLRKSNVLMVYESAGSVVVGRPRRIWSHSCREQHGICRFRLSCSGWIGPTLAVERSHRVQPIGFFATSPPSTTPIPECICPSSPPKAPTTSASR